ncbi:hypothetical protein RUM43_009976 [Polyplax serrata]|uniref:Phosphoglucomutase-2 n=1 Tax=Polyplax serrata TaxID=468196 RepID=A0AAN8PK49_POLSC
MNSGGETMLSSTSNPDLDKKIEEWLKWDKNEKTLKEVQTMVNNRDYKKLSNLFLNRLEFGTAGLRARMGAGYNQMNDLVVIQTAQGLCEYLLNFFNDTQVRGIVLGYDGRYNSKRFAELTASVFLSKNIKVFLFSDLCPTPFIPFAVKKYDCVAGVMVTASHNPKDDNGYKVYWRNGAQIIPPHDKEIQKSILKNLEPRHSSWDTASIKGNPNLFDPMSDILVAYYDKLQDIILFPELNQTSPIGIVYTAMHGVGYRYVMKAFEVANLKKFCPVVEQVEPDPEFPTVPFPNPEEGKSALNLSIETASKNGCTLILANDPDADRLAVAEKSPVGDGHWKIFSGNELGALLGWWSLFCYKMKHQEADLTNVYMLASTVSSKILNTMAKSEGFKFEETLTGFKWMGNVANDLMESGKTVLFAFEEAIGFMCGTSVLDKDGVSASVKIAEMAAYLKQKCGQSLQQKLNELYLQYGQHVTLNSYYVCYDPKIINSIFFRLRNFKESNNKSYPQSILNGKYQVCGVRDLTTGYDDFYPDKKARLPTSNSSQMITFRFTNGLVATLRTSGTEPKLKYYSELCADPKEQNRNKVVQTLNEMIQGLINEFLEPERNGLLPRAE